MFSKLTMDTFISGLIDYMFILLFCLIGAIIKDTYNTITEKDTKVKISRILVSTLVSSIILFSISDFLSSKLTWKLFILPCFIGGGIGFELFGKINKIGFWIKVLTHKGDDVLDMLSEISKEENNKESTDNKK